MNLYVVSFVALVFASSTVFAQQTTPETTMPAVGIPLVTNPLHRDHTNKTVPLLFWHDMSLTSKDGEYLAQTKSELQTYYDLGLTYQYIDSPLIRQQLQLPESEGILVQSAKENGEGYQAGLRAGDLVLRVQDEPVDTQYDFVIALDKNRGKSTEAKLKRDGVVFDLAVELSPIQSKKRWILGVAGDKLSEALQIHLKQTGVIVNLVTKDGPAEGAGIEVNDIIVKIDDEDIGSLDDLRNAVQKTEGGETKVTLMRAGVLMELTMMPVEHEYSGANRQLAISRFLTNQRNINSKSVVEYQLYSPLVLNARKSEESSDNDEQTESSSEEPSFDELLHQIEMLKNQVEKLKSQQGVKDK